MVLILSILLEGIISCSIGDLFYSAQLMRRAIYKALRIYYLSSALTQK